MSKSTILAEFSKLVLAEISEEERQLLLRMRHGKALIVSMDLSSTMDESNKIQGHIMDLISAQPKPKDKPKPKVKPKAKPKAKAKVKARKSTKKTATKSRV